MDDFIYTEPQALVKVWNGSGIDFNWTNPANWAFSMMPVAGDSLKFPAGANSLFNINDFPVNTEFTAPLISGHGYLIGGN